MDLVGVSPKLLTSLWLCDKQLKRQIATRHFYEQSMAKGHVGDKQNVLLWQVKFWVDVYDTFHWEVWLWICEVEWIGVMMMHHHTKFGCIQFCCSEDSYLDKGVKDGQSRQPDSTKILKKEKKKHTYIHTYTHKTTDYIYYSQVGHVVLFLHLNQLGPTHVLGGV